MIRDLSVSGFLSDLPTVILVCMLSLSTRTLLRITANRATRMYVRLMSNTIEVPETHTRAMIPVSVYSPGVYLLRLCTYLFVLLHIYTFKLVVQVVHISDETVVGKQEAHSSQ